MNLPKVPLVVLDTETTGFVPRTHKIIEFASVRVRNGKVEDSFETLIGIEGSIPPHVEALTRIHDADIEGKPIFADQHAEILKHIGEDTILVGQNIGYDLGMLKGEGLDLSDRFWIDTSMLASLVFPELESYSLGYMSSVLPLNHEPKHRAMGDVHATLELLEKCWDRLSELTPELQEVLQLIMSKSTDGYKEVFKTLPKASQKKAPKWITMGTNKKRTKALQEIDLEQPEVGIVDVIEESLNPNFLQSVINSAAKNTKTAHWIAVKNINAMSRALELSDDVKILRPAYQILDFKAAEKMSKQDVFTSDEATLAVKLAWFEPKNLDEVAVHGDERSVWSGKLACTDTSKEYTDQFKDIPSVVLIDHRQMLNFLADPEHAAHNALKQDVHIILDDASMLEDTATKAYGWYSSPNDLRAGAVGDEELTHFVDLLQLWIEKTRNFQELRYIVPSDLETSEARGLRHQLAIILERPELSAKMDEQLTYLSKILDPSTSQHRIEWIELRMDGSQFLHSVSNRVSEQLKENLYDKYSVSLIVPPQSADNLHEVIPAGMKKTVKEDTKKFTLPIVFDTSIRLEEAVKNPLQGKSILLASSRKIIESMYIKYSEELEKKDVTLICQGLSGGQGRMQAEFLAAKGTVILITTPWTFESFELAENSVDHLLIDSLPFDHPSQAVFSKRAEHYRNAFEEYSLPRLEHRLFRLLRTFCKYKTADGDVLIVDDRLATKDYGRRLKKYLELFNGESEQELPARSETVVEGKKAAPKKPKAKKAKPSDSNQLELF